MTDLKATFLAYNRLYFSNSLPPDTIVVWTRWRNTRMGEFDGERTLRIALSLKKWAPVWKITLLHEMAHLATASEALEHGPRWEREMLRLAKAGAFRGLW